MEALFRFNIVRDARRSADEVDPIDLGTGSAFQQAAAAISAGPKRREALKDLARTFITSPDFVSAVSADADLERLDRVSATVDQLIESDNVARTDLENAVTSIVGTPSAFIASSSLPGRIEKVIDSILAIKRGTEEEYRSAARVHCPRS